MRIYDIIKKKRDKKELSKEEIRFFIDGIVKGEIPDYQTSALLMAIYFNGMSDAETAELTFAIRDSGEKLVLNEISGIKADKHSTGGVGDKTSLVVMPIVASLGIKVAKMSGRGLGHTGGTVDKLEAIDGFKTEIDNAEFAKIVNENGIAIIGQTKTLAPADKILYSLRDVTATIDSIPLIASSIMGKKLTADDDVIVLDVKTGSGAFMQSEKDAVKLAKTMVEIGKRAGKKIVALITDMSKPLGNSIGNSLEVIEAIETLNGNGEKDLLELSLNLSAHILRLSGKGDFDTCLSMAKTAIEDKSALNTFIKMVKAQGGNVEQIIDTNKFKKAKYTKDVLIDKDGYIVSVDAEKYGLASLILGAGRNKKEDKIDLSAGIILHAKTGDKVKRGQVLATMYTSNPTTFEKAEEILLSATDIKTEQKTIEKLIKKVIE